MIRLAVVLLFASAVAQAGELIVWRESATELRARGFIAEDSHTLFTKDMLKGARTLTIDSGGGHVYAAARIGRLVRDAGIEVRVETMCLSACATYIFVPAARKTLLPGAIIGLHKGSAPFDLVRVLARLTEADLHGSRFMEGEAEGQRLYAVAGIDPAIEAVTAHETGWDRVQLALHVREQPDKDTEYRVGLTPSEAEKQTLQRIKDLPMASYYWVGGTESTYWFPDRAELEHFGVTGILQYAYPQDLRALHDLVRKYEVTLLSTSLAGRPPRSAP